VLGCGPRKKGLLRQQKKGLATVFAVEEPQLEWLFALHGQFKCLGLTQPQYDHVRYFETVASITCRFLIKTNLTDNRFNGIISIGSPGKTELIQQGNETGLRKPLFITFCSLYSPLCLFLLRFMLSLEPSRLLFLCVPRDAPSRVRDLISP
jgi:hypothetical protein